MVSSLLKKVLFLAQIATASVPEQKTTLLNIRPNRRSNKGSFLRMLSYAALMSHGAEAVKLDTHACVKLMDPQKPYSFGYEQKEKRAHDTWTANALDDLIADSQNDGSHKSDHQVKSCMQALSVLRSLWETSESLMKVSAFTPRQRRNFVTSLLSDVQEKVASKRGNKLWMAHSKTLSTNLHAMVGKEIAPCKTGSECRRVREMIARQLDDDEAFFAKLIGDGEYKDVHNAIEVVSEICSAEGSCKPYIKEEKSAAAVESSEIKAGSKPFHEQWAEVYQKHSGNINKDVDAVLKEREELKRLTEEFDRLYEKKRSRD